MAIKDEPVDDGERVQRTVNQQPISVENFRSEVSRARGMLELYAEIRRKDIRAIDARIAQPRSAVDKELAAYFSSDRSWRQVMGFIEAHTGLALKPELGLADNVLAEMVSQSVAHVRPRAIKGFELPITAITDEELRSHILAAHKNYRLRQAWYYPDLRSAIYMQFYMLVTQNRPMRPCENPVCKMPFPVTKKTDAFAVPLADLTPDATGSCQSAFALTFCGAPTFSLSARQLQPLGAIVLPTIQIPPNTSRSSPTGAGGTAW